MRSHQRMERNPSSTLAINEKKIGEALQLVAEGLLAFETSLAQLSTKLHALKLTVAQHLDPASPTRALQQIQALEDSLAAREPGAEARRKIAEAIEIVKAIEKHGSGES